MVAVAGCVEVHAPRTPSAPSSRGGWYVGKRGPATKPTKPTKLRILHGDCADRINAHKPEPPAAE